MADRRGSRVSFFSPAYVSVDSRGRLIDVRARQQLLDHRPHRGGAQNKRFLARPGIEHAVREDVAPLEIGAELDLVNRQECDVEVARHGFDGRDPKTRVRRLDLLFAGDQGDGVLAGPVGHLVVDLARQQPQRQADHAGRMRQHALDGEMGLAGIGWAQHCRDAGAARSRCSGRLRGKSDGHYASRTMAKASSRPRHDLPCITMRRRSMRLVKH